jgi:hypothetical protein
VACYRVNFTFLSLPWGGGGRGGVVVKALRYKPAGRGFDSRWFNWNFSVTILPVALLAVGSTQPLTEMNTRCISWGVKAAGA